MPRTGQMGIWRSSGRYSAVKTTGRTRTGTVKRGFDEVPKRIERRRRRAIESENKKEGGNEHAYFEGCSNVLALADGGRCGEKENMLKEVTNKMILFRLSERYFNKEDKAR